jgi:hypothetical protein
MNITVAAIWIPERYETRLKNTEVEIFKDYFI